MTRLARAVAFAAWAWSLAFPVVAPAGASQALLATVCSADGTRTAPLDDRHAGHAAECPCCTSAGTAALPAAAPAAAPSVGRLQAIGRRPATAAATARHLLPPSCGPPA